MTQRMAGGQRPSTIDGADSGHLGDLRVVNLDGKAGRTLQRLCFNEDDVAVHECHGKPLSLRHGTDNFRISTGCTQWNYGMWPRG